MPTGEPDALKTLPPLRRRAWGALLADAPWDGRPRVAAPIRIPATVADRMPDAAPALSGGKPPGPKRRPFGALLAGAPWGGKPPEEPEIPDAYPERETAGELAVH